MKAVKILIPLAIGIAAAVLLVGFVIPIRLEVEVNPDKLYRYEDIERDDVNVYLSPLFKRGKKVTDFVFDKSSSDQYDDITVQQTIFYKKEHIRNVKLDHIDAVYEGTTHEGDVFNMAKVKVKAIYNDGSSEEIQNFEVLNKDKTLTTSSNMVIKTDLGSAKLEIPFQELTDLIATYTTTAYEGDDFEPNLVSVVIKYEDDTELAVENFKCQGENVIRGETDYTVYTPYGQTILHIEPVTVRYAKGVGEHFEHEVYNGQISLEYEDGTTQIIDASDVEFAEEPRLVYGENAYDFTWKGNTYTLYVSADYANMVSEAKNNLTDEVNSSIYNEMTSRLFATITKHGSEKPFYLTHVVITDPSQIRVESTGMAESPAEAAKKFDWVVATNGSFFNTLTGTVNASCLIRRGQILMGGATTGNEICIMNNGALYSPPAGVSAQDLVNQGCKDILFTTDPLLIQDGNIYAEGDSTIGGENKRTAVGMVRPGEYYLLTSDSGLTYSEMQGIFASLGCQFARSLDGGSSTTLMYKDRIVNSTTGRNVADFLAIGG